MIEKYFRRCYLVGRGIYENWSIVVGGDGWTNFFRADFLGLIFFFLQLKGTGDLTGGSSGFREAV